MTSSRVSKPTRIYSRIRPLAPRICQGYEEPQFETYLKAADTAVDKQAEAKHAVEKKNHDLDAAVESGRMPHVQLFPVISFAIDPSPA
uniref:Uncharacterized protein n=1 Tax=Candidatus Kentrum sp. MB TaxID=2138164 RepID=A0A450XHT2_9GAMM|nr:MAG: hypothetical protein BECKMB1821G_GA0114241_100257 [Candidatus Kentron sp. MB]VFK28880.1 MAG: hypothetical protein BECKMB1821I_GA0114274_100763 [Candidatus Kentron sp. MB]VFK74131.1 MAG: hypothetical protein BECKMB1821H_GA0114242_100162 [Candidatus Kentron sp. MB]